MFERNRNVTGWNTVVEKCEIRVSENYFIKYVVLCACAVHFIYFSYNIIHSMHIYHDGKSDFQFDTVCVNVQGCCGKGTPAKTHDKSRFTALSLFLYKDFDRKQCLRVVQIMRNNNLRKFSRACADKR